jgi:pimeloyl-ACP methyl ester carboxylesterase
VSVASVALASACGAGTEGTSAPTSPAPATAPPSTAEALRTDTTRVETAEPTVELTTIAAPSLAGNLLGDPAELEVAIRLPASYDSTDRRYPVVYFLAGYGEPPSVAGVEDGLQELVDEGLVPEVIVVAVSGVNALGGSFYVDSPVTGDWARAVHTDLVDAIDDGYRTLDSREARGIAGFSMGGFGALDMAMRHPDVFGAVYALSPGLFAPSGLASSQMFDDPATIEGFLEGRDGLASMPPEEAVEGLPRAMGRSADVRFSAAYGAAFAPDPASGPPYIAYPYDTPGGPRDEAVWERWEAGFGGIDDELRDFADELRSLRGILVDVGTLDEYEWIPEGVTYSAEQATLNDVAVRVERYDGGHGPIGLRAPAVMWPFFGEHLATT